MDKLEQEKHLFDELGRVLERFTREYDFTHCQVIGVIELIKMDLIESNDRGSQSTWGQRGGVMTVKQIIKEYLITHGFEGLSGDDCACELDDLIPCDNSCEMCEPGYKHKCPEGYERDFIITNSKEHDFNNE